MEALKIDLNDYVHAGEGANGESFNHKTDPSIMMKLYNPGKVQQPLDEMLMARKVYELGIPSPEPGDYVTDGVRYGIRFRRMEGKVSYSRATADHPEKVEQYAAEFAEMCKKLHQVHVDTTQFENVKDRYYRLLEENPFFDKAQKDAIGKFIADAPDATTAIHGDLQFSNAIFVGDKRYFIDLGDFCYGFNLFDVGMVYLCCLRKRRGLHPGSVPHAQVAVHAFLGVFCAGLFRRGPSPKDIDGRNHALRRSQDPHRRTRYQVPHAGHAGLS